MDAKIREAYLAEADKDMNKKRRAEEALRSDRRAPAIRPVARNAVRPSASASQPQRARKARIVNERMASRNPSKFLTEAFIDENGRDAGYPPFDLSHLIPADRAHLQNAADDLNLWYETTVTSVMVIGSSKNLLAFELHKGTNNTAGWPPERYSPHFESSDEDAGDNEADEDEEAGDEPDHERDISGE